MSLFSYFLCNFFLCFLYNLLVLFAWFYFFHLSVCLFSFLCMCLVVAVCFSFCCWSWILLVYHFFCLFLFFFLYFFLWPHCEASGHLVPCPGVRSGHLGSEHWVQCWTTREFLILGNVNQLVLSWRYPSQHQDLAPHNCPQASVLETSCQPRSKTGMQPHPLAERLPKIVLSSQTPQNTWSGSYHQREKTQLHPPECRYQFFPPESLLKPLDQTCWPWGRQ